MLHLKKGTYFAVAERFPSRQLRIVFLRDVNNDHRTKARWNFKFTRQKHISNADLEQI